MTSVDWGRVTPDEFEELCFELVRTWRGFAHCEWFKGPSDRGRDIRATFRFEDTPGHYREEQWIVECKRYVGSVSPSDISNSVQWAIAHQADTLLILTTGWLTAGTRDLLEQTMKAVRGIQFQYIEGSRLEEEFRRSQVPGYDVLLQHSLAGLAPRPARIAEILSGVARSIGHLPTPENAHAAALKASLPALLAEFADDLFPSNLALLSLWERHIVTYDPDAGSHTTYEVTGYNAGDKPITFDEFRLFADIPVHNNEEMHLRAHVLNRPSESLDVRYAFDIGTEKILNFLLKEPCPPGADFGYEFGFDWPTPKPLAGLRHYSATGRRPKASLDLVMRVPDGYHISSSIVLHQKNGLGFRYTDGVTLHESGQELLVRFAGLGYQENVQIVFQVDRAT